MDRASLLRSVLQSHYYQPATALWRTVELETIAREVDFRGHILDLGCGDGGIGSVVFPSDCRVDGIDYSQTDLLLAQATGRYERLCVADAGDLPFVDNEFDMVFSNSVLEHIPQLVRTLGEVGRSLRVGGEFVFTVPSDHFIDLLGRPRQLRARGRNDQARRYVAEMNERLQHHHYLSVDDWKTALCAAGLQVEKSVYYLDEQLVQAWERWHLRTGALARRITGDRLSTRDIQMRYRLPEIKRLIPLPLMTAVAFRLLWPALKNQPEDAPVGGCLLVIGRKV